MSRVAIQGVNVRLPDHAKAPGFRDGIRDRARFTLAEVTPGFGLVAPVEGAGVTYEYFTAHKICDANTPIDETALAPLRDNPARDLSQVTPRTHPDGDPNPDWQRELIRHADDLHALQIPGSDLAAIQSTLAALPVSDVPDYLKAQMPAFFDVFPDGSWWLITTDELLLRRFALMRALLGFELSPDLMDLNDPVNNAPPDLRALEENSLTSGIIFSDVFKPLLLVVPLSAIGFAFNWTPHTLVFLYGMNGSLIRDWPPSLSTLYEPRMHSTFGLKYADMKFVTSVTAVLGETLLQWWVTRLNVLYSNMVDPTRFADSLGRCEPARQTAWYLTVERMLADMMIVRTSIQRAELVRHQAAFDLLDKAETLLGFGSDRSGDGFELLLRRKTMIPRLNAAWERLPLQLRPAFATHAEYLYNAMYEDIRSNALQHRLTAGGVKVRSAKNDSLRNIDMDGYAGQLIRAIRNSAHGLLEQLTGRDRFLLATHNGKLPPQLPDLAVVLAFAMIADAESLCAGDWIGNS